MGNEGRLGGSFRDPSGFMFSEGGACYRQVNAIYEAQYQHLMQSGLYEELVRAELLVPHEEVSLEQARTDSACRVLKPELVPFISYPYEWCFSQLKDAALATLEVQKVALRFGMTLKDSSAYNIQFLAGTPRLIDTLSFEFYREGQVWTPYRQFCQHFLAPLVLMSRTDVRLGGLLRVNIDGVPLDLASALLPRRTWLRPSLLLHVHVHARTQKRYAEKPAAVRGRRMSRLGFEGLIDSLATATQKLTWKPEGTEWGEYYDDTNYSTVADEHKGQLVAAFLDRVQPHSLWDLGANTGRFSRIAADRRVKTIAFDVDPACVEKNYVDCVQRADRHLLPLLLDLTNPSPSLGWNHEERLSLVGRGPADTVMGLALIHHLAISNNVPLPQIAAFLSGICQSLIIEFVPKEDSQVQKLLASREDVFPDYTRSGFEQGFAELFHTEAATPVRDSKRTLYLMRRRASLS